VSSSFSTAFTRAEAHRRRVASGGCGRRLGRGDEARDVLGIGADREGDAIGEAGSDPRDARSGRHQLERHGWEPGEQAQPFDPTVDVAPPHDVAAEIRPQCGDLLLEARQRLRDRAHVVRRRVAATDREHAAAHRQRL
jgi:hypothetical protein